jgi:hypothetical protein
LKNLGIVIAGSQGGGARRMGNGDEAMTRSGIFQHPRRDGTRNFKV